MFFKQLEERVLRIKNNPEEINNLINEYKPFISATVSKVLGRFVEYGRDEELSVALSAFMEAVRGFDKAKGAFLSFAKMVIRKRLIDYFRKERRYTEHVSLEDGFRTKGSTRDSDETGENDYFVKSAIENFNTEKLNEYRRLEIIQLKDQLKLWDLSFNDIVAASPKQEKLREIYREAICCILCNPDITKVILNKKYLPLAEIEKISKIPRKKLERGRNYIIASVIILTGDYEYIRDFIEWR